MTIYDLGDGVELRHKVYNSDGELTAATVSLVVTKPDASTIEPDVSTAATGIYDAETFTADQAGPWSYVWTVTGSVIEKARGGFAVADPAPISYATRDAVKSSLGKITSDDRDDLIDAAITAASRLIDARTGRRFYLDASASARVFPVRGRAFWDGAAHNLLVDDLGSTSGLVVETGSPFSNSWTATTTYATGPDNALTQLRPVTSLRSQSGWGTESVRVTGRWGWPAVPAEIGLAAQLLAARLYRRKDSPQGVIGSADWGAVRVSRVDPDVEALIAHLILPGFA